MVSMLTELLTTDIRRIQSTIEIRQQLTRRQLINLLKYFPTRAVFAFSEQTRIFRRFFLIHFRSLFSLSVSVITSGNRTKTHCLILVLISFVSRIFSDNHYKSSLSFQSCAFFKTLLIIVRQVCAMSFLWFIIAEFKYFDAHAVYRSHHLTRLFIRATLGYQKIIFQAWKIKI